MSGTKWGKCAALLVWLSLLGCAGRDYFGLNLLGVAGSGGNEFQVAGSLDSVSQSMQGTLQGLGLSAVVTQRGEDIRIASRDKKGDQFALVLTRVKNERGESTKVRIEWDNGPDEQTRAHLVAGLQTQKSS